MRAWDGTWLRRRTLCYRFRHCATCNATTRHASRQDAVGLWFSRCLVCLGWNEWV